MADRVTGMPARERLLTSLVTIGYCVLTRRSRHAKFTQKSLSASTVADYIR